MNTNLTISSVLFLALFGCNGGVWGGGLGNKPTNTADTGLQNDGDTDTDADTDTDPGDSDTQDTDTDTDDTDDTQDTDTGPTEESLTDYFWDQAFTGSVWTIDHTQPMVSVGVTEVEWVDIDVIGKWDASTDSTSEPFYASSDWNDWCKGDNGSEGSVEIPNSFTFVDATDSSLRGNGIYVFLQSDFTVAETTMTDICTGFWGGWVADTRGHVRDANALDVWGAHGGSQMSALPWMIREGEFTRGYIDHPVAEEWTHEWLSFANGLGYTDICHAADSYAEDYYWGTVPQVMMCSLPHLPEDFDCDGQMLTVPGLIRCEASKLYGVILLDDPWGSNEYAVVVEEGVREEVQALYGIEIRNASSTSDYFNDMKTIITNSLVPEGDTIDAMIFEN